MNALVVVATQVELQWLFSKGIAEKQDETRGIIRIGEKIFNYVIAGMGIVNTISNLIDFINNEKPSAIINIGLCGSSGIEYPLLETYLIASDYFSDLAIIRKNEILYLHSNSILNNSPELFYPSINLSKKINLNSVAARTVSTYYNMQIESRPELYFSNSPFIETMEGAAVFSIANKMEIPVCALRTVSNYLGDSPESWDIPAAVEANNRELIKLLSTWE